MKRKLAFAVLALACLGLASCAPTYRSEFLDSCKADGNTEKQCITAFHYADRIFFARENPDGQSYTVLTSRLTTEEVEKELNQFAKDFHAVLDYKNQELASYIGTHNLRKPLEHREEVITLVRSRVSNVKLDIRFQKAMGKVSSWDSSEQLDGYNPKKIFSVEDPAKTFPFTSDQIEEAKSRGVLKPIEHVAFDLSREYDRKEKDPTHPEDSNEFVWRGKKEALDITNYKIVDTQRPDNNLGNYMEGFRVVDGKKESHPALKIFFPSSGGTAVVVLDSKREGKDPGFGVPDFVEQMAGVLTVTDVVRNDRILAQLFDEKPKDERVAPQVKKIFVEVAPVGKPVDVWTKCTTEAKCNSENGWLVPFKYPNDRKSNYAVTFKYAKPQHDNPEEMNSQFHKLKYVAKIWTGEFGTVWEYYKPKSDFEKPLKAEVAFGEEGKKLHFVFPDGSDTNRVVTPGSNLVIEDAPYAIVYRDGQKWYWIEKDKSSVFNKKRETSEPKQNFDSGRTEESGDAPMNMPMSQTPEVLRDPNP